MAAAGFLGLAVLAAACTASLFPLSSPFPPAYPVPPAAAYAELHLHIPDKMMEGHTYHGVAVTDDPPSAEDGTVFLAAAAVPPTSEADATTTIISIPHAVTMPAGSNHALFTIKALRDGLVEVHAAHAGEIARADGQVFSTSTGPHSLDLILPGKTTTAPSLAGLVMLLDENGRPVRAPSDTDIRMVPSGLVDVPDTVRIQSGQTGAAFPMQVNGSGRITAANAGLTPDTEHITYDRGDTTRVMMAAAPDVVLPGGAIHYSVWLERGGGGGGEKDAARVDGGTRDPVFRPYRPAGAVWAELQTTDTDMVRLTEHLRGNKDNNAESIMLEDGMAAGVAYAGAKDGLATITATVPGYGVASADVCVGAIVQKETQPPEPAATPPPAGAGSPPPAGNGTADPSLALPPPPPPPSPVTGRAGIADSGDGDRMRGAGCGSEGSESFREYMQRMLREERNALRAEGDTRILTIPRELPEEPPLNHIRLWLQPPVTSSHARAIVGFYHMDAETIHSVTLGENSTVIDTESEYTRLTPVRANYNHIAAAVAAGAAPGGGGGVFMDPTHMVHPTHHTNAYDFPVSAYREGDYTITATAAGHTDADTLTVVAPHEVSYHLQVVPLHVIPPPTPAPVDGDEDGGGGSGAGGGGSGAGGGGSGAGGGGMHLPRQPLYMISITDDSRRIIDIYGEFGRERMVRAIFEDGTMQDVAMGARNTGFVLVPPTNHGDGTHHAAARAGVMAALEGRPAASAPFSGEMSPVGIPASIEMDAPRIVHGGEAFPVTAHMVDPFGVPVKRVAVAAVGSLDGAVAGTKNGVVAAAAAADMEEAVGIGFATNDGLLATVKGAGTHRLGILHATGGSTQSETTSFLNRMSLEVDAPEKVSAGRPFPLRTAAVPATEAGEAPAADREAGWEPAAYGDYGSPDKKEVIPGVSYDLDSPWPVSDGPASGAFVVTPTTEGDASITIRITKDGYAPQTAIIPVRSEMSVSLSVTAVADTESAPAELGGVTFTAHDGSLAATPYEAVLAKPGPISFTFPESFEPGYGLVKVTHAGALLKDVSASGSGNGAVMHVRPGDESITVTAEYERRIRILVTGGSGSGTYPYGAPVPVAAEPRDVIPFIIPERLSHWTGGAPEQAAEFVMVAERDMEVEAVFEPDYARVTYAALAAAAAGGFAAYRKLLHANLSYVIGSWMDRVREHGRGAWEMEYGADVEERYDSDGESEEEEPPLRPPARRGAADITVTSGGA